MDLYILSMLILLVLVTGGGYGYLYGYKCGMERAEAIYKKES